MTSSVEFGKVTVSVDDFCKVADNHAKVVLNTACLAEMARDSEQKAAAFPLPILPVERNANVVLSVPQTRALIAARILTLLEAQTSMRAQILVFFAALLNADITPWVLRENPLTCLAAYCQSSARSLPVFAQSCDSLLFGEALKQAKLELAELNEAEFGVFVGNQEASLLPTSRLALFALQSQQLADLADCATALTCAAARVSKFSCRPHKQSNVVASHVELLLQDCANQGGSPALSAVAPAHGAARGLIESARSFAKVELNSIEAPGALPFNAQPALNNLQQLFWASLAFLSASVHRIRTLLDLPAANTLSTLPATSAFSTREAFSSELSVLESYLVKLRVQELTQSDSSIQVELALDSAVRAVSVESELAGQIVGKASQSSEIKEVSAALARLRAARKTFTLPLPPAEADNIAQLLTTSQQICTPKIPQGTRDTDPNQMAVREKVFSLIRRVFQSHGAVGIDTPIFERKEVLAGKGGEDSQIYDLADQGGEMLSLRYDLTVPFARYVASNHVSQIKRYHLGRVYRRGKLALREFYQCDFDIAGSFSKMLPDAEIVKVLCEIMNGLKLGQYTIKFNHTGLLSGLLAACGVTPSKFRAMAPLLRKYDTTPWPDIRDALISQGLLSQGGASRIGVLFSTKWDSPRALLAKLKSETFPAEAIQEVEMLLTYVEVLGCLPYVTLDLSLDREMEYTGVVYECVLLPTREVVAGGGRYDNLVSMFSTSQVPAVGITICVEAIFAVLEEGGTARATQTEVLVASSGPNLLESRMALASLLWREKHNAEFMYDTDPTLEQQFEYARQNGIPYVVWRGQAEMAAGIVRLRDMAKQTEVDVPYGHLLSILKDLRSIA